MSKRISKLGVPNPNQHQDFDNVLKKTFTRVYTTLIQKLLGIDLKKTIEIPKSMFKNLILFFNNSVQNNLNLC